MFLLTSPSPGSIDLLDVLREGSFVGFLLREGFLVLLLEGGVEVRDEELVIDILQYLFPSASCPLSLDS
jgi:hypothetical protein